MEGIIKELIAKGVSKAGMARAANISTHYLDLMADGTEMSTPDRKSAQGNY